MWRGLSVRRPSRLNRYYLYIPGKPPSIGQYCPVGRSERELWIWLAWHNAHWPHERVRGGPQLRFEAEVGSGVVVSLASRHGAPHGWAIRQNWRNLVRTQRPRHLPRPKKMRLVLASVFPRQILISNSLVRDRVRVGSTCNRVRTSCSP